MNRRSIFLYLLAAIFSFSCNQKPELTPAEAEEIAREKDWILSLAGASVVRVAETTRMAAALYRNGIPFYLRDGKEIMDMVRGKDYIGIVPDHVFPRYCHGLFPAKDRIIDFINLPFEFRDQVIHHGSWYPPDEVLVK